MTKVGNNYQLSVKLVSMLHAMDEIEMEELGHILPKQRSNNHTFCSDDPGDLEWFKNWYRSYIKDHIKSGTISQIQFKMA